MISCSMKHVGVLALLLTGCGGTWSNADLEYANALPSRAALKSKLPVSSTSSAPLTGVQTRHDGLNVGDASQAYANVKSAQTTFNGILDFLLTVLDNVRSIAPTTRTSSGRIWGPFEDANNPGVLFRVVINAQADDTFGWALQFSQDRATFTDIVTGAFKATSGSVKKGQGAMVVHVKDFRDVVKVDDNFKQLDQIDIAYATDASPITVQMLFTFKQGASSGLSAIGFHYEERDDQGGTIHFQIRSTSTTTTLLDMQAGWLPNGQGRAFSKVLEGTYTGANVAECWDTAFTVQFYAESWAGGQTSGVMSNCASVPGF